MLRFLLKLTAIIPFCLLYRISDLLAFLSSHFYRKKVVSKNIHASFPDKSEKEQKKIIREFYRNFSDVLMETLKIPGLSAKALSSRIILRKNKDYQEIASSQSPVIFLASHQCNWEWLGMVVHINLIPLDVVYKPLKNKNVDSIMIGLRSKFGSKPIPSSSAAKVIRKYESRKGAGVIVDQSPHHSNRGKVWTKFLGQETPFFQGIFVLPYLTQLPVYLANMKRTGRGKYEVWLEKIGEPPYEKGDYGVLHKYVMNTEKLIQESPSDWLWSHNRWKYDRKENEELINFQ